MTYSQAKGQGQRQFGPKDREYTQLQTDGRWEVNALPPMLMQKVLIRLDNTAV